MSSSQNSPSTKPPSEDEFQDKAPFKKAKDNSFGDIKEYMKERVRKLKVQEQEISLSQHLPSIFKGIAVHVNGYTKPSHLELKNLICSHGGDFEHYYVPSRVTHIVATNLNESKKKELRNKKVVKPEWIIDSITENRLLPWESYRLYVYDEKQQLLRFPTTPKGAETPEKEIQTNYNPPLLGNSDSISHQTNVDLKSQWARQHTSIAPDFLEKFYQNSRLHFLSVWKKELQDMTRQIIQDQKKEMPTEGHHKEGDLHEAVNIMACLSQSSLDFNAPIKRSGDVIRRILHVDMDCFFASVSLLSRPDLQNKPVVISHTVTEGKESTSEIASCNYHARKFGIRNGMRMKEAKEKCPHLAVLPYDFPKYKEVAEKIYKILLGYRVEVEPVSCDEAYLDISSCITEKNTLQEVTIAQKIRSDILELTQCCASIGIGPNILVARMATRVAKPDGFFVVNEEEVEKFIEDQNVNSLPGVGWKTSKKLAEKNIRTCKELRGLSKEELQLEFGNKTGEMLYNYCRGEDHRALSTVKERKSIGVDVGWGVRFEEITQIEKFLFDLAKEVSKRMVAENVRGKQVVLKIKKKLKDVPQPHKFLGHGYCDNLSKSMNLSSSTNNAEIIGKRCWEIFSQWGIDPLDVRGVGIQIQKLESVSDTPSPSKIQSKLDRTMFLKKKLQLNGQNSLEKPLVATTKQKKAVVKEVFDELPEEIKLELKENFDISFVLDEDLQSKENDQQKKSKGKETIRYPETLADLESGQMIQVSNNEGEFKDCVVSTPLIEVSHAVLQQQGIDPQVFKNLPEDIQNEIRAGISPKKMFPVTTNIKSASPSKSPFKKKKKIEKEQKVTLTQQWQKKGSPSKEKNEKTIPGIDLDVLNALPEDFREEAIRQQLWYNRKIKPKHFKNDEKSSQFFGLFNNEEWNYKPLLLGEFEPSNIRKILFEWRKTFQKPTEEDLGIVSKFLRDASFGNLENTRLLLIYIKSLAEGEEDPWSKPIDNLINKTQKWIVQRYGAPVQL